MLDRSRPYGEICGTLKSHPGAAYTQDGKFFNGSGMEIVPLGSVIVKQEAPKEVEAPKAPDFENLRAIIDKPVLNVMEAMKTMNLGQLEAVVNIESKGLNRATIINRAEYLKKRITGV